MHSVKLIALALLELLVLSLVLGLHSISNHIRNWQIHKKIKREGYSNSYE